MRLVANEGGWIQIGILYWERRLLPLFPTSRTSQFQQSSTEARTSPPFVSFVEEAGHAGLYEELAQLAPEAGDSWNIKRLSFVRPVRIQWGIHLHCRLDR